MDLLVLVLGLVQVQVQPLELLLGQVLEQVLVLEQALVQERALVQMQALVQEQVLVQE